MSTCWWLAHLRRLRRHLRRPRVWALLPRSSSPPSGLFWAVVHQGSPVFLEIVCLQRRASCAFPLPKPSVAAPVLATDFYLVAAKGVASRTHCLYQVALLLVVARLLEEAFVLNQLLASQVFRIRRSRFGRGHGWVHLEKIRHPR